MIIIRIKSLETFTKSSISIVKVTTDEGQVGYGQMSPFNADITAKVFHRQVAPHALGQDPLDIESLVDSIFEAEYKYPGTYICRAVCGLDTALWDLKGKLENKSVCELLGGTPGYVKAYGSSMRRDLQPKDEAKRLKEHKEKYGFEAFKIKIGKVCGHDQDQWPKRTEELLPTVREAIGDDCHLFVDANSCYTPEKAIEVGEMLKKYNVVHYEEPCPYWKLDWTAEVTKAVDIPVTGGEQDNSLEQWKRIIDNNVVNVVQPDVCYLGGISRTLKVAKMAEKKGLTCTPHSANLSMVTLFTMHLLRAIPNAGNYMEYSIEDNRWAENLFYPALDCKNGQVSFPTGPGWGVEVNQDWLDSAEYQINELA